MQQKKIYCPYCGKKFSVSVRTLSIGCPSCYKHISVEDFTISSNCSRNLIETCGSVFVTPTGSLQGNLRVHDLQVEGKIQGDVRAEGKITLASSADLHGDITAGSLEVSGGARLKGFCRIVPAAPVSEKPSEDEIGTE